MNKAKLCKEKKKMLILALVILSCIASLIFIILPPSFGRPKPFLDRNGNILEGSISEKIFVDINGASLGMFIIAKDQNKPVMLMLGGGPGIPEFFLEQEYPSGLADEFVVCYLEYRGTSLSYESGMDAENITLNQYIEDVVKVTNYLQNRFKQKKIYLMGHSFGSYIGLNTVYQHPELYHSYVAMAQITNSRESEILAYNFMLSEYKAVNNDSMVERFEEYPITKSDEALEKYVTSNLRDMAMHDLGVGTTHNMRSIISDIFLSSLRCTAYSQTERINIWRGKAFASTTPVAIACRSFNAFDKIAEIKIPIYFFGGIYDYTVCYSLQKDYFEHIQAPLKAFYTFDNSAHSPLFEESEKAMAILVNDVLAEKTEMAD